MQMFKNLSEAEAEKFRQWARDNFKAGKPAEEIWHPVVREEWARLQSEAGPLFLTTIEVPKTLAGWHTDDIVVGADRGEDGPSVWLNSYGGMMGEDGSISIEGLSEADTLSVVNQIINALEHAKLRLAE